MTSIRFQELEKRINVLRVCFLPGEFDPTGTYNDDVYEHTRAFRVLAHAEFESFIEDRVVEVIDDAFTAWKSSRKVSVVLLAAVAYRESAKSIPESLYEAASKRDKYPALTERVEGARTEVNRYVRNQNHGIKERNMLRMLLPIGVQENDIDTAWLNDLDAWATSRGDAAHKGAKMQVQPDPHKELATVDRILKGFSQIDLQVQFL